MRVHIAQVNITRFMESVDDDGVAAFMAELDEVNALADTSPGFVWRLQDETGNATGIDVSDDPRTIINMSVWETADALFDFVYKSAHKGIMGRRKEWFERLSDAYMALWWVPVGTVPTVEQAMDRLAHLGQHGPTPEAFTFKVRFPPS